MNIYSRGVNIDLLVYGMMKKQACHWKISSHCLSESWKCGSILLPPSISSALILAEERLHSRAKASLRFFEAIKKIGEYMDLLFLFSSTTDSSTICTSYISPKTDDY